MPTHHALLVAVYDEYYESKKTFLSDDPDDKLYYAMKAKDAELGGRLDLKVSPMQALALATQAGYKINGPTRMEDKVMCWQLTLTA
ncbi:unnamed protein product, partial [Mesorhabditis spiculigera]